MAILAIAVSGLAAASALAAELGPDAAQCKVVHYAADGNRTEAAPTRPYQGPHGARASVVSSGSSTSHAAVSASANSTGAGQGSAVIRSEREGRAITKTYDNAGCTIVVDDRPAPGGRK